MDQVVQKRHGIELPGPLSAEDFDERRYFSVTQGNVHSEVDDGEPFQSVPWRRH
jgi:hypothetical protein